MPALATFLGAPNNDGSWLIATNWQGNVLPNAGDDIALAPGNNPSKMDIPGFTVRSLTLQPGFNATLSIEGDLSVTNIVDHQSAGIVQVRPGLTLSALEYVLSNGTLMLEGDAVFTNDLSQNGGNLELEDTGSLTTLDYLMDAGTAAIGGDVLVTRFLDHTGGTIIVAASTGSPALLRAAEYNLAGGTLSGAGGVEIFSPNFVTPGQATVTNAATVSVGTFSLDDSSILTIANNLTLSGTALDQQGTTLWANGTISLAAGASFANGGSFDAQSNGTFSGVAGTSLVNTGTIVKTAGNGLTTFDVRLTNSGPGAVVRVANGEIQLDDAINAGGTFDVAAGKELTIADDGLALQSSGTVFTGAGTVSAEATITLSPGVMADSTAKLVLDAMGTGFTGGTRFRSLTEMTWKQGRIEQMTDFVVQGQTTLEGAADKVLTQSTFTYQGNTIWKDTGNINLTNAVFANNGQFEIQNAQTMLGVQGAEFRNGPIGTVAKTGGNKTTFELPASNEGTLLLQGREIKFDKGLSQAGQGATDLGGGTVELGAGMIFLMQGGNLRGGGIIAGSITVSGGIVDVGDVATRPTLSVTGNYIQTTTATLRVTIHKVNQVFVWGLLDVGGNISTEGSLQILMPDGPVGVGDEKEIVKWGGVRLNAGIFNAPAGWTITYGPKSVKAKKN